ncbi:MAG: hypothetical protein H6685_10470 [Deltaproteobacteria bacterium]|nr:hypothetical protein [Deltaproteobacteria bacterium]
MNRPIVVAAAVLGVGTVAQCLVGLFGIPGYEAAQIQAFYFALVAGPLAIALTNRRAKDGVALPVPAQFGSSLTAALTLLAIATAMLLVSGFVRRACEIPTNLLWTLWLPAVSTILAVAWATFLRTLLGSTRWTYAAYAILVAGNVFHELWIVWSRPVVFAYNALLGYFPGPVYDDVVSVTTPLIASRGFALSLAVVLVAAASLWQRWRDPSRGAAHPLTMPAAALASVVCVALAIGAEDIGTEASRARIQHELGGKVVGPHVTMYYPEDLTDAEVRRQLIDLEFRFEQQSKFLGIADAPRVTAYYYRDADEKKRLMGAGDTQMADCSNREMHMNIEIPPPHEVLKHEIIHVLAGPWGIESLGFSRVVGMTEGLAVAAEVWRDDYTIPQWAAAMKRVGRLPSIAKIAGPLGFWRLSGSRSYLAWGGFVTWLVENFGMEKVKQVYGDGDFEAAFGATLPALARQWETYLDTVPTPDDLLRTAAYKFFRPSLFEGRCARVVGRLRAEGFEAAAKGRYRRATEDFAKAYDYSGGDPRYLRYQMSTLVASREYDEAWQIAQQVLDAEGADLITSPPPGQLATGDLYAATQALDTQADIAWLRGDDAKARALYTIIRDRGVSDGLRRKAAIIVAAIDDPRVIEPRVRSLALDLAGYLRPIWVDPDARRLDQLYLAGAADDLPDNPIPDYIIGRELEDRGAYDLATTYLRRALYMDDGGRGLPDPAVATAAWFSLGQSLYNSGAYAKAELHFRAPAPVLLSVGHRQLAAEWAERAAFARNFEMPSMPRETAE